MMTDIDRKERLLYFYNELGNYEWLDPNNDVWKSIVDTLREDLHEALLYIHTSSSDTEDVKVDENLNRIEVPIDTINKDQCGVELPNGKVVGSVYQAYEAGLVEGKKQFQNAMIQFKSPTPYYHDNSTCSVDREIPKSDTLINSLYQAYDLYGGIK